MPEQDLSSLPPIDIGRILGVGLDYECRMDQISAQEKSILANAKVPIETYFAETVVLAGFARDYAIVKLLGNAGVGQQVRDGYLEIWTKMGQQTQRGAAVFQLFIQRCPEYAKAAERMHPGEAINPVGLAFSGFLAADNDEATLLALTYAPEIYFLHFERTLEFLQQAKLIRKTGD